MSIINLLIAARNAFKEWGSNERAYSDLLGLDDHLLADLGLHRSQLPLFYGPRRAGTGERRSYVAGTGSPAPQLIRRNGPKPELARSRPARAGAPPRWVGAARLMLIVTAIGAACVLPAFAAQFGTAARYGISPTQPFSATATSPLQQQMQQDYRTNLLAAQRDLLRANPSGLGRQQIEIQHQVGTLPPP